MKVLIGVLLFIMAGCSTLPDTKEAITKHGKYSYHLSGNGPLTIVFEAGLTDNMTTWEPVLKNLKENNRIFAYNRAGYGASQSKNLQRDGSTIINELRELLAVADVKPPYLLVGHSIGGTYMELYAKTFPKEVSGVVLVDAKPASWTAECEKSGGINCALPVLPAWVKIILPTVVDSEMKGMPLTMQLVNENPNFPNVPLVVLSAGKSYWGSVDSMSAKEKVSWETVQYTQKQLSNLSPNSKQIICDICEHYIHHENPKLVTEAIQWISEELRDISN
ncbi:alpha/beta fold hydrolase [Catenovulum agarivorans]|uniref:alpha/beta fold hydrolase n=1 Tax=Catenovulum agarivorans TaxID=1172192 RepID=UPI00030239D1|nr:alpha/beta hydrolase [Catenovulum agarivorans]